MSVWTVKTCRCSGCTPGDVWFVFRPNGTMYRAFVSWRDAVNAAVQVSRRGEDRPGWSRGFGYAY